MKQSKQPSTKEKTRMLLTGIWRNHQNRFMDLVGELEELAVGLLLEMPGNKFNPKPWLELDYQVPTSTRVSQVELVSLRKDPRVYVKFENITGATTSVAFDDLFLEDREKIVGKMIEKLEEKKQ